MRGGGMTGRAGSLMGDRKDYDWHMHRTSLILEVVPRVMLRRSALPYGGPCPEPRGARRPNLTLSGAVVLLASVVSIAACSNGAADQVTRPVALGMTSSMMPYYSDGQITLYQVQIPVQLPVRQMTSADVQAVGAAPTRS